MFTLGDSLLKSSLTLVHASAAAYQAEPADYSYWSQLAMDRHSKFPMEEYTVVEDAITTTNGFVASNFDHLIVSFRGTDDVFDVATNLSVKQDSSHEHYEGGVHDGFARALDRAWLELRSLIDEHHTSAQKIWVTGHSLGGALATLAAKRLNAFMSPVHCITFGQPRVGDPTFSRSYAVKHNRFVNEGDVIPKLPPRGLITRYWHVGNEERIDAAGNLISGEGDTSLLEDLFFGRLANQIDLTNALNERALEDIVRKGLVEHGMSTYVNRIQSLAKSDL